MKKRVKIFDLSAENAVLIACFSNKKPIRINTLKPLKVFATVANPIKNLSAKVAKGIINRPINQETQQTIKSCFRE